jgi:hypothetical protein
MTGTHATGRGQEIKQRAREELRKFLFVSAYLFVCLLALLTFKAVLLGQQGLHAVPLGFAVGKALILGKFLLIGEAARIGRRVRSGTLLQRIGVRVLSMTLLLIVLTVLEEIVVGWFHGHTAGQALAEMLSRSLPLLLVQCLLMALILVPLIAFLEIDRTLGAGTLRRLLLAPAADAGAARGDRPGTGTA